MKLKRIGAVVGLSAVLAAVPLAACGSTPPPAVTVTATPTATYSFAPCPPITDPGWEACVDSHRAQRSAESSRSASASASAAQAQRHQSSGIPTWVWLLIVPGLVILVLIVITIGGAVWEANESPRHAVRRDGAVWDELRRIEAVIDDEDDDDDDEPEPLLTYPAITPVAAEPIPYPEPSSVPVAPAPSGSLMDRLGGK
ncbi:hypothetical protein I3U40_00250 [Mycobacteroides abscessus subsp. abscessus]|uniref:hypothetical protein n=1 Tax=Mycobacteroides abscessus TaxID=36809 RepID=UPI0009C5338D|nr:hypothetical protein [Mycobacteroides abscessus]QSM94332.1 hypothetical protein I3U31_00250 [Mycobacteroides abscessus subsp. abscessus]QSM99366.1 hypothetical protein I3U40_00250 [Mycobacteroides abscessus subsp. abscessus]SLJ14879.1 putative lipoprotein [Mycobacteroides abscessus subsp. abscessus]